MQCNTKVEILFGFLGSELWAVTTLPSLQESRPEILRVGKREKVTTVFNDLPASGGAESIYTEKIVEDCCNLFLSFLLLESRDEIPVRRVEL